MKTFLQKMPTWIILGFLTFSLLYPAGNKFDTAPKIYLVLAFGWLAAGFFIFALARSLKNKTTTKTNRLDLVILGTLFAYAVWTLLSFFQSQTANFGFTEVVMLLSATTIFVATKLSASAAKLQAEEPAPFNLFDLKLLFQGALALLILNALAGIILYLFTHHTRAFGLFFNPAFKTDAWPNAYASFVLFLWPLYFYDFWKAKRFFWLRGITFSIILASFLLTFSRAGFLAFGGQMILLTLFGLIQAWKNKSISWKKLLQLGSIILLTASLTSGAQYAREHLFQKQTITFEQKAQFSGGEEVTSVQERINFMKGAVKLSLKEPLFGYGPMSFSYVYRHIQTDWLAISDHPHNIFLKIAAENGLPALLFFNAFLLLITIKIFKNYPKLENSKKLPLFILSIALLGGLAHHLVDYNLNFATNFIIFWLLLTSLDNLASIPFQPTSKNNHSKLTITTLGLTIFTLTLSFTAYESYNTINYWLARKSANPLAYQSFENSLFPKYFFLEQADQGREQKNYEAAASWYNRHLQKNRWDSATYNRLGELQEKTGHLEEALQNYQLALTLDPKNSWAYYKNTLRLLTTQSQVNQTSTIPIDSLTKKITKEMQQYLPKAKQNLHFTAQHQESLDAIAILRFLLTNYPNDPEAAIWKEYLQIIQESREKYNRS